ncbi:MAG: ketopantoate reductase family protein [Candidatus Hydrogenedentes bacterium]|nr:ketopantoate reductase family protein [Candidatus Hydrogenedentota bacterium]
MNILIAGAGAIGSVVGGFMAEHGHAVSLIGRAAHMEAIRAGGLHVTGIWGKHHVTGIDTRTSGEGFRRGEFNLILVTVKAYDTAATAALISPLVDDNTLVCSYQNGLGNAEAIAARIGWERTIGARAIYGVVVRAPGHVDVTVIANPTAIGAYHADAPVARVREIAEAMHAAGMPTVYTDRIRTVLWNKVAYNCALNPMSALLDVPYGALLDTEHTRETMREIVHELYAVAKVMDVPMDPATPEAYIPHLFNDLIPPTAAHYASMRADFINLRRTEIDALNGAIARLGDQHGIACPTNTLLTRLVHAKEFALGSVR